MSEPASIPTRSPSTLFPSSAALDSVSTMRVRQFKWALEGLPFSFVKGVKRNVLDNTNYLEETRWKS